MLDLINQLFLFSFLLSQKEIVSENLQDVLSFWIANEGQVSKDIKYYGRFKYGWVAVTDDSIYYYVFRGDDMYIIREKYRIKNSRVVVMPVVPTGTKVNYIIGNKSSKWIFSLPAYKGIEIRGLDVGITVRMQMIGGDLEKIIEIEKGSSLSALKFEYIGVDGVEKVGDIVRVQFKDMELEFIETKAWDETGKEVRVTYVCGDDWWSLESLDQWQRKLVVDPLLASRYVGGSELEGFNSLFVSSGFGVYAAGATRSPDLPVVEKSCVKKLAGKWDGFVALFDLALKRIISLTYIGGRDFDEIKSVFLYGDSVYVGGETSSGDFPVTENSYAFTYSGEGDAFVCKFSSDLSTLKGSTYLGGTDYDWVDRVAVGKRGVYLLGTSYSADFPITEDAYCNEQFSIANRYICRLNFDLDKLLSSTYLPNASRIWVYDSYVYAVISDPYLYPEFPFESYQPVNKSFPPGLSLLVLRLLYDLTDIDVATYFGPLQEGPEDIGYPRVGDTSIVVKNGKVYVAGITCADGLPVQPTSYQKKRKGDNKYNFEIMLGVFDLDLKELKASTYLGGSESEFQTWLAVDGEGNVYVAGETYSRDFPIKKNAYYSIRKAKVVGEEGVTDYYLSKFDSILSNLEASTLLPVLADFAVDEEGNVYLVGRRKHGKTGKVDAYIIKLSSDLSR